MFIGGLGILGVVGGLTCGFWAVFEESIFEVRGAAGGGAYLYVCRWRRHAGVPDGAASAAVPGGAEEAAEHTGAGRGAGPQSRVGDVRCEQAEELWAAAPAGRGESRAWGCADRGADGGEVRDADYVLIR